MKTLSTNGITLIKSFEGLRLNAYKDKAGVWTIGYGSTLYANGHAVKKGDKLKNTAEADALFSITLQDYVEAVNRLVKVPLTQNQFDALVSFAYNAGTGALAGSTLLKKLNAADYEAAANQFLVWNKVTNPATGQKEVYNVLVKRRAKERALFLQQ